MTLARLQANWTTFSASPHGKRIVKVLRGVMLAVICGLLAYQLSDIGWGDIWNALPQQPWFYVILLLMYLLLPTSEAVIYSRLWGVRLRESMPVFFRKRVLNADVLGYSGEVYLYLWAKDRLPMAKKEIMASIKDNLIVSSMASLTAAILLLGVLLATGFVALGDFVDNTAQLYVGGSVVLGLLGGLLMVRFRRVLFSLPRRDVQVLGAVHVSRFLLGYVLQVLQWWVVLPGAPFETWALLLVVFVLINRIPFLPSSDLVFVSAGAGLSPMLDVPVAPVVGMLLVRSAIDRLLNAAFFGATLLVRKTRSVPAGGVAVDAAVGSEPSVERSGDVAAYEKAA